MTEGRTLLVSEVFGPTFQGEGPHAGRLCSFVRLGLCNLDCKWCDTPYTWDWTGKNGLPQDRGKLLHLTPRDLLAQLPTLHSGFVVVSGGEPLVQQLALVDHLPLWTLPVHVETNGTIEPSDEIAGMVDHWSVSPKLPHAETTNEAWRPEILRSFVGLGAAIKVVVRNNHDVNALARRCDRDRIPADHVWVMPEGRDAEAITRTIEAVADVTVAHGFNLTGRLHVQAWGDKRGV